MTRENMPSGGPPVFKIQGVPHHKIGSLLAPYDQAPSYAQLYLLETGDASVLRAEQSSALKTGHARRILYDLDEWLRDNNQFAKTFLFAKEKQTMETEQELCVVFDARGPSSEHERRWNLPQNHGMCGLVLGLDDVDWQNRYQHIVLTFRNNKKLKI